MLGESRAASFCQTISIDHIGTLNPEAASLEGHVHVLAFKGLATGWVKCGPMTRKNEGGTTSALQHMTGPKEVSGFAHSDWSD